MSELTLTRRGDLDTWLEDGANLPADLQSTWVVLSSGDEARARDLLEAGAAANNWRKPWRDLNCCAPASSRKTGPR